MNQLVQERLTSALQMMPNNFTGNQFYKQCRKLGIGKSILDNGYATRFLEDNSARISQRQYLKIDNSKSTQKQEQWSDEMMIAKLKEKGYKILKPSTEYIEI